MRKLKYVKLFENFNLLLEGNIYYDGHFQILTQGSPRIKGDYDTWIQNTFCNVKELYKKLQRSFGSKIVDGFKLKIIWDDSTNGDTIDDIKHIVLYTIIRTDKQTLDSNPQYAEKIIASWKPLEFKEEYC
jgi:hypothetical protein